MNLLHKNKSAITKGLSFLNTKPGFRSVFTWISDLNKSNYLTKEFIAAETVDGFMLGTYSFLSKDNLFWRKMIDGTFEPKETKIVKDLMPKTDIFVDIGANIGYYGCLVGAQGIPVHCFEPFPKNVDMLKKNLRMNAKTWQVYDVALSDAKGSATIYGNNAMASIVKETYSETPSEQVTIKKDTLDSYISIIPPNKRVLMKIDVEGNEFNILKGGLKFIDTVKPFAFLMEVCENWASGPNPHFKETLALMKKLSYKEMQISDGSYLFTRNQ